MVFGEGGGDVSLPPSSMFESTQNGETQVNTFASSDKGGYPPPLPEVVRNAAIAAGTDVSLTGVPSASGSTDVGNIIYLDVIITFFT